MEGAWSERGWFGGGGCGGTWRVFEPRISRMDTNGLGREGLGGVVVRGAGTWRGVAFTEATPRARLGRPFRAWWIFGDGPRALPWHLLGCAVGAFLLGEVRCGEGVPPLPGRKSIMLLDRWLTSPAFIPRAAASLRDPRASGLRLWHWGHRQDACATLHVCGGPVMAGISQKQVRAVGFHGSMGWRGQRIRGG